MRSLSIYLYEDCIAIRDYFKSVEKLKSDLEMQPFGLLFGVVYVFHNILSGRILGPSINDVLN